MDEARVQAVASALAQGRPEASGLWADVVRDVSGAGVVCEAGVLMPGRGRQVVTGVRIECERSAQVRAAFETIARRLYRITEDEEELVFSLAPSEFEEVRDVLVVREVSDLVEVEVEGGVILAWYWADQDDPQVGVRAMIVQVVAEELRRAGATPAVLRAPGISEEELSLVTTSLGWEFFAAELLEQRRLDELPPPPPEPVTQVPRSPLLAIWFGPTYPIWDEKRGRMGRVLLSPKDGSSQNALSLARDGASILVGGAPTSDAQRGVYRYDIARRAWTLVVVEASEQIVAVEATRPDGVWAMATRRRESDIDTVTIVHPQGESTRWSQPGSLIEFHGCHSVQLSPDGALCAVYVEFDGGLDARTVVLDSRTGEVRSELESVRPAANAWHPSGRSLLVTPYRAIDGDYVEFDLHTGETSLVPSIEATGKGVERAPTEPVCWLTPEELLVRQIRGSKTLLSRMARDGSSYSRVMTLSADDDTEIDVASDLIDAWTRRQAEQWAAQAQ